MRIINKIHHGLVLAAGMLVAGTVAVIIGKELNWDLASYHLYNPFAYWTQRANLDLWPVEFIHTHLAPTADFITYYFVMVLQPKTAVFLLGALHGINFWLLYVIALTLFAKMPRVTYKRGLALLLASLGMYGPTVVPGIGSFQHDAMVSIFVLAFVLIILQSWQYNFSKKLLFIASVLLGVGAGLKLTACLFVLSAMVSVIFIPVNARSQLKILIVISIGALSGVMLVSGYWFVMQWREYDNPIFPLMNGIFHSPYFPAYNWKDARFMPKNWLEILFFPFYFSFDGRTNDVPFRDFRFIVVYILLFLALLRRVKFSVQEKWLLAFFVSAYILWQAEFSIMRYAMPLEMLAPILVFCLLDKLCRDEMVRNGWVFAMVVLTVMGMYPAKAVRAPIYAGNYFNVKIPDEVLVHPQSLVLMPVSAYALALKPRPQTYLVAYLPRTWRYVGVAFQGENFTLTQQMRDVIQSFTGQVYILSSSEYVPLMTSAARQLQLSASGECVNITSDRQVISEEDVKLCPFKKASSPTDRL